MGSSEGSERVGQHPQQNTYLRSSETHHITKEFLCELEELAIKHSHLGCYPDLASLSVADAYGLYLFLSRIDGNG